jgi:MFS family permease
MPGSSLRPVPVEVRDFYGRRYRVGETDRELTGRSRRFLLLVAWAGMMAVSVGQYGFGAVLPSLGQVHGWSLQQGCWVLAVWTLCQAATVYPVSRLRDRFRVVPSVTLGIGAVLCATGLVTLANHASFVVVLLNHGVLGGIGAGLVYATCLGVAARWYPERPAGAAFVSGAFAYGAIPFILLAGQFWGVGSIRVVLAGTALVVLVVLVACAVLLKDPPPNWWPAHLDPRAWALDKSVNHGLRYNRPAIRHYSPAELFRNPTGRLLFAAVLCAATVALFDIAYLALFTTERGWSPGFGAAAVGVLAAVSGAARPVAGWAANHRGRGRVLRIALCLGGAAQFVLLTGGEHRIPAILLTGAFLVGAAVGTCYSLLPGLVEGYFGEGPGLANFGLCYGAKAIGGLLGAGLAASLAMSSGHAVAFTVAALLSFAGAGLIGFLRQPGLPRLTMPGMFGMRS